MTFLSNRLVHRARQPKASQQVDDPLLRYAFGAFDEGFDLIWKNAFSAFGLAPG